MSLTIDYHKNFLRLLSNSETRYSYNQRLRSYMKYKNYTDYSQLVEGKDRKIIENEILDYLTYLKEERKMMPKSR